MPLGNDTWFSTATAKYKTEAGELDQLGLSWLRTEMPHALESGGPWDSGTNATHHVAALWPGHNARIPYLASDQRSNGFASHKEVELTPTPPSK
eukprot:6153506-Amphidinium_carterae.2